MEDITTFREYLSEAEKTYIIQGIDVCIIVNFLGINQYIYLYNVLNILIIKLYRSFIICIE